MAQFYTLLTAIGQAKLANAVALGNTIALTHLAVGDGGGTLPTPDSDRTALVNEQRRAPINLADIDPDNPNWIVVEQVLPPDVGGWTIREIGVFDSAGDLIAYGNYPETYKPTLDEGSGRTQTVRMVLQVSDTAAVTLRVDPSVVLATRKYVDDGDEAAAQAAAEALQEHAAADEAHAAQQITIDPVDQASDAETVQQALAGLGAFAADSYQNIAVFDTAGVTNWTVPDVLSQGLRKAHVTVIGGGGGGRSDSGHAGGGGGGGLAVGIYDLSETITVPVTVGNGGLGGQAGVLDNTATEGGSSSFGGYASATGGERGGSFGTGGIGGVGTGGFLNTTTGSGVGASRFVSGESSAIRVLGGAGGGAGGVGGSTSTDGSVTGEGGHGIGPGGGGGGGDGGGKNGGNGAAGIVIVRW